MNLDADNETDTKQTVSSEVEKHRAIALENKRPGGVELNVMGDKGLELDQVENNNKLPSQQDLETYRIIFQLFDRENAGFIDAQDLAAISIKLNRDPNDGKYICAVVILPLH